MSKYTLPLAIFGIVILVAAFLIVSTLSNRQGEPVSSSPTPLQMSSGVTFNDQKKSAHFESSTPEHGAVLAAPPINIVINFNFDLGPSSSLSIGHNGTDYGSGETVIDPNKLAMRRNFKSDAPDGLYKVTYNACWPDGSCHDGAFEFELNRSLIKGYKDLRNQPEVTIDLANVMFEPMQIRISTGTKVIWTNSDDVEHFVNTDSHPAHTYFPDQNSRGLQKGDSYSTVFSLPGIYPYHCSAHADTMVGAIVVE